MPSLEVRPSPPASVPAEPESPTLSPPKTIRDIFPAVTKAHILNCAYPRWHPVYRALTPKTRIVPLTPDFISYLREDGIVLPSDETQISSLSDSEDDSDPEPEDDDSDSEDGTAAASSIPPNDRFPDLHTEIKNTIASLDGRVAPKLNWSAPKDASFMSVSNTIECRSPGEIYLLLKSSDFITHDLEHAFDDCIDTPLLTGEDSVEAKDINYSLVLRKWFNVNPSMEFRVFVRGRKIIGITQRELNHFDFLQGMTEELVDVIQEFFEDKLKNTFPDGSFVFDCYVPSNEGKSKRVWLIDINPFAPRTDPILFSWMELLEMEIEERTPELRLVKHDDPEAYNFVTPQYSSSKMPQEVVEAGLQGDEAVWEFAARWKDIVNRMENSDAERRAQQEN